MDAVPEREGELPFRERFVRILCRFKTQLYYFLALQFAFVVLAALWGQSSLRRSERSSTSRSIRVVTAR